MAPPSVLKKWKLVKRLTMLCKFAIKVTAEKSAERDEHDAGSRERALDTAAYEGTRNPSRRNNGRDGRKYCGKNTSNTNSPVRGNSTKGS